MVDRVGHRAVGHKVGRTVVHIPLVVDNLLVVEDTQVVGNQDLVDIHLAADHHNTVDLDLDLQCKKV